MAARSHAIHTRPQAIPPADKWELEPLPLPEKTLAPQDPYLKIRRDLALCEPTARWDAIVGYFSQELQKVLPTTWWGRRQRRKALQRYQDDVAQAMAQLARRLFVESTVGPSQLEHELNRLTYSWQSNPNLNPDTARFYCEEIKLLVGKYGHKGTERRFHG